MEKLDNFKLFVKKNPILLKYIKNNEMTWQKFYEIYDMYGEEDSAWHDYMETEKTESETLNTVKTGASIGELFNLFKGINLDNVQEGIQSIQRVVGMVGDLSNKNSTPTTDYKPRPLYKHFDD